jgi:hypothetical protein
MEAPRKRGMGPIKVDRHADIGDQCDHHQRSLCLLHAKKAKNNHTYKEKLRVGGSRSIILGNVPFFILLWRSGKGKDYENILLPSTI